MLSHQIEIVQLEILEALFSKYKCSMSLQLLETDYSLNKY